MHWTFQPVGGPWFTALVVAVLLALVVVVPQPRPEGKKLWALRGLRLVIVLLTFIAMLRPTLTRIETKPLEASLLLLIDDSRSMQVADSLAGATRWEAARRMLADSADAIARLSERWDVRAFRFGEEVSEVTLAEGRLALPPEPTADATALGSALQDVLERSASGRLLGVVLLSDGAQRAIPPRDTAPQIAVRRLVAEDMALYTVALGLPGGAGRADLAIEDLTASESVFVKAPTEVTARLRATGYANRTFTVQLLWENEAGEMEVVNSKRVEIGPQGGAYPVRLEYTPLVPGEQKITVRVVSESGEPEEGELITSNNQRDTFLSVRDGGVKVLYLVGAERPGGAPGLEQRFVRAALAASPDIVVTRQVYNYKQPRRALKIDSAAGEPDVVLIDNLDSVALNAESWRALAERVRTGTGLGMIGGRQSFGPGGYRNTPVGNLLPIEIGPAQRQGLTEPRRGDVHLPGPLRMLPAKPFGLRHPIMQIASGGVDAMALWQEFPELDGANKFNSLDLKPNAMVLAESSNNDAAGPNPRPLLVVGQAGRGRVLATAIDSTWRWRLEGFSDAHRRFWRQAVLWLARKDDSSQNPVWVRLDSRLVPRGGRLDLRMGVRDLESDPQRSLRYEAWVETPDGRRVDLATGGDIESAAVFTDTRAAGDYTVKVKGYEGENALGETEARFNVPDQDLELDNPAAEPSLMAGLAAATSSAGGRAIAPEELPELLKEFADRDIELEEEVVARITYWDTWPFFLLLVGLLGVEWYLRKRWGLV